MNESYLVIFHVGPVQDFIATARRSRDLWFGSWMLSELAKAAAKSISDSEGQNALIFPAPELLAQLEPGSQYNVPNKIVAIVSTTPKKIGKLVKDAVSSRLKVLRDDAFDHVHGQFKRELAENQINDLIEYYWVALPYEGEQSYPDVRAKAEAFLAARKNTRDFRSFTGDYLPKSSLDGSRESVIPETAYPQGGNDPEREYKINRLFQRYRAHPGERLSGVDLLKRLGILGRSLEAKFYSTSHYAALSYIDGLQPGNYEKLKSAIAKLFVERGRDIPENDGALLFESRIPDWVSTRSIQDEIRTAMSKAFKQYADNQRPNPYYVLLAADGDNMGKIIDAQVTPDAHRNLSQVLSRFANQVPMIVEKHQGGAIYSGGDDILSYLPLHTALACAAELEEAFRKQVNFHTEQDREIIQPTLSAGMVIAHHLTPLSDVLEMAREAGKTAKNKVDGKNGLCIVLDKRSGPEREIYGKWQILGKRLEQMIDFTRQKALSQGTAYELHDLQRILGESGVPLNGIAEEALRVIRRKRESGGEKELSRNVKDAFEKWLVDEKIQADILAQELIIAATFAGALDMASGNAAHKTEEATIL